MRKWKISTSLSFFFQKNNNKNLNQRLVHDVMRISFRLRRHYAKVIFKRGYHSENASNAKIIGCFGFVVEEKSVRNIT